MLYVMTHFRARDNFFVCFRLGKKSKQFEVMVFQQDFLLVRAGDGKWILFGYLLIESIYLKENKSVAFMTWRDSE